MADPIIDGRGVTIDKWAYILDNPRKLRECFEEKILNVWAARRPKFEDFDEIYTEETIARDAAELKKRRDQFLADDVQRRTIPADKEMYPDYFEAINLEMAERGFFGPTIKPSTTHTYDDVMRQTDLIFSVGGSAGYADTSKYMAVDATVGILTNSEAVAEKHKKIDDILRHGDLPELQYFSDSAEESPLGRITMPRSVIAVTYDTVDILIRPLVHMKLLGAKNMEAAQQLLPRKEYSILRRYCRQALQEVIDQLGRRITLVELEPGILAQKREKVLTRQRVLLDRILHVYRALEQKS